MQNSRYEKRHFLLHPAVFLCLLSGMNLSGKDTGISKYSVARRDSKKGYSRCFTINTNRHRYKKEIGTFFDIPHDIDGCSGLFIDAVSELKCPYLLETDLQL
jgi:hypothetical protein